MAKFDPAFTNGLITNLTNPDLPADSLASKQFQTLIDLISEGVISGFPSATGSKGSAEYNTSSLKDVFLNGTQVLQQAAGTSPDDTDFNFQNISFEPRFGTSDQTPIEGISDSESETAVGVTVTKDSPVSRSITDTNIDAVRVTIAFPQLQKFEDNGDINGAEVALTIQTIENDGTTQTVITDTVKGRAASTYFRDYRINFVSLLNFPVTIRVNRTTDDSTDSFLNDSFQWSSFTEIINESRPYANSAHIGLRFDAETFPSVPSRMYRVRGTLIKIPHNGTVRADGSISYSGTFNGTFKTDKEYSNDPAWVLYDLLTTSKGFGDHIDSTQLDVFSFYAASVYCSEQVDDMTGSGNTEARFSTNVVLNTQRDAYSLINDLSSVMRVMPFYSAGVINISQDRPTDPSYIYNLSNVTAEGFSYSNASKSTKATVVNVGYFDNETQSIDYETVEDTALQAKYGIVVRNLKGFATTSRGQAARLGKWFLYTQSNEAEICSFKTSIESGTIVRVGTIISVQDPMRAGVRKGGRIKTGVSTTVIIVDRGDLHGTDMTHDSGATLSVILSNGTLETKTIDSIIGTTITVTSAFSSVPLSNSVWVIESTALSLQTFRVFSVKEVNRLEYEIQAVAHNPSKYASVEDGSTLQTKTISNLTALKPSPSNLQGSEQIVVLNNRAVSKLFIQWQPVSGVTEYMVQYRFKNENFISERVSRPDFTIFETQLGTYEIRVFSYNALGKPSTTPSTTTFTTVGKTALPADPSGLTLEPVSDQFVRLRFNPATDVDVLHGGTVSVRHTPSIDPAVATFQNSTEIIPKLAGNITETLVPALTGTYSIKFIDDTGNRSDNAARIIVTAPDPQPNQIILTEREDTDVPPFQGEKVNTFYDATFDGLLLDGTLLWDSITQNIDDLSNIDFAGPINSSGSYEFQNKVDMGAIFNLMLKRRFVTSGLFVNDLIDSRTALIDTWTEFDGTQADDVNAKLLVATTDIDPATSVSASYEQSGTTITITKTDHGYSVGDFVVIDFTAGSATDGNYEIQTVPNANTFTVTASASATISSGTSCTYGANFTQFNTFANGEYTARGFKFKCELESNDPAQNINVTELGFEASVKRRTETVNTSIASGTSAKTVTFANPFFTGTGSLG
ncbi:host specificity protein J, partial [Hyphomonas sp.]|uniref:host specificity protein J n=1 Tax=Hyphomonas sp. TaxID=87 RepID=UPI0025B9161D